MLALFASECALVLQKKRKIKMTDSRSGSPIRRGKSRASNLPLAESAVKAASADRIGCDWIGIGTESSGKSHG